MASKVQVGGYNTSVPGVYSDVDVSALSGKAIDLNILGVVADLPFLEKAKPIRVGTAASLRALAPTNTTLQRIASIIYKASSDNRIEGAPAAVVLCSPTPTTQAQLQMFAGAKHVVTVASTAWGMDGNKTYVEYTKGGTELEFKVSRNGVSETHTVALENAFTVTYTGAEATTLGASYDPDYGLLVIGTKAALTVPASVYNPVDMAFDGTVTMTIDADPGPGNTTTIIVKGVQKTTGLVVEETVTWENLDPLAQTTVNAFSSIQSFTSDTDGATATYGISFTSFDLTTGEYATAAAFADRINAFAAQKFVATKVSTKVAKIPSDELDVVALSSILGAVVGFPKDLWALLEKLGASALITAERAGTAPDTGDEPPDSTTAYLAGGSAPSASGSDWTDAETALRVPSVQVVWFGSTDAGIHATADSHCIYMAGKGANERNVWLGAPSMTTKTDLFSKTGAINSRHCAMVAQDCLAYDYDNRLVWMDPMWFALFHAAMQCGTRPGVALTRKRPRVYGVRNHSTFDPVADEEELLDHGVCVTQEDDIGYRCLRSVTTYQEDDNRAWTEVSTNESVNTSVRDLRENLDILVGDEEATAGEVLTMAKSVLRTQVSRRLIKWLDEDSVAVTDAGDVFVIEYNFQPIEPKNFIMIKASAVTNVVVAA